MSNARHASLAGQLYAACDGVPEILKVGACRLDKTRLYEFADPRAGAYMPADVIADLEAYCGQPIYSQQLLENRPSAVEAKALMTETMELAEFTVALMGYVRIATSDGHLDADEKRSVHAQLDQLGQQILEARTALDGGLT
jgi:hypothetical protein